MRFLSFLNDFGIIPNEGTSVENDPSLRQGQSLNDYNRYYNRNELPYLNELQNTGIPGVESVTEAMDTSSPKVRSGTTRNDDITKLKDKFDTVLAKYNATYKLFSESVLTNSKADKQVQQYFGQAVTSNDGNYAYINDYGFTHKYSMDAWSNNNVSCPSDAITVERELFNTLKPGPDMVTGQPCGIAGKNIRKSNTKEYAWVDIKGYKHVYSTDVWKQKSSSCEVSVTTLNEEEYNAIPNGSNMTATDTCLQLDIDPAIWDQLIKQNDELLTISRKFAQKLKSAVSKDNALQSALTDTQQQLGQTIDKITNDRSQLNSVNKSLITVNAEEEDTKLNKQMHYTHMVVWLILLITVISLTVHAFLSSQSNTGDILGVVFALIFMFAIVKWVMNKF